VQLIEQSPVNMDAHLLGDLAATIRSGPTRSGISNKPRTSGPADVSGINPVHASTATVVGVYPKIADAVQQIHRAVHGSYRDLHAPAPVGRSSWLRSTPANRPLIPQCPMNPVADMNGVVSQGLSVTFRGCGVHGREIHDQPWARAPTKTGSSSRRPMTSSCTRDPARGGVLGDEGRPTVVLFRFYNYLALHSERYPSPSVSSRASDWSLRPSNRVWGTSPCSVPHTEPLERGYQCLARTTPTRSPRLRQPTKPPRTGPHDALLRERRRLRNPGRASEVATVDEQLKAYGWTRAKAHKGRETRPRTGPEKR